MMDTADPTRELLTEEEPWCPDPREERRLRARYWLMWIVLGVLVWALILSLVLWLWPL